ncbi:hypothetical protein DFLDMN_006185 (plasmid) [Cupriavidus sp. H19C3]|uniref:Na+/H+ antiporter NhaA n=1 Tax=Cupriavidus sp. H19C3 TaxID=3241603 RepID=UPI003BF82339
MKEDLTHLPKERADKFTRPFLRFLRIEAMAGATLLFFVGIALAMANTEFSDRYFSFFDTRIGFFFDNFEYSRTLQHWVNDGLMTLFFFVVALELKREIVLGELTNIRLALFPMAGAIGGMIMPVGIYLLLIGDQPSSRGWGTVMSTDTAFVIGALALLRHRVPKSLRLFLLALAIFDDIAAILIVAISYGGAIRWLPLMLACLGLVVVAGMGWVGFRSMVAYSVFGIVVWVAFDASGIHATLTGVILGLMAPARSWVSDERLQAILSRAVAKPRGERWSGDIGERHGLQRVGVAAREALSPIERLEITLHPWIAFAVMPAFALANAGVTIVPERVDAALASAIFFSFVLGKPVGIIALIALAVKLRVASRPKDLTWRTLIAGSMLAGIGFTMALFIANLSFNRGELDSVKIGIILGSFVSATAGMLALAFLGRCNRH